MFRTTYYWAGISKLMGSMKNHLRKRGGMIKSRFRSVAETSFVDRHGVPTPDYHLLLRELFCSAAQELAMDLGQPLQDIGVMFNDIVHTGRTPKTDNLQPGQEEDLERDGADLDIVGKRQLLFLVRHADIRQSEKLESLGYRFARIPTVLPIIASTFEITTKELNRHVDNMRQYVDIDRIMSRVVFSGIFVVKASMGNGFDVLVSKDARNQLPTVPLAIDALDEWQIDMLGMMDAYTLLECLEDLAKTIRTPRKAQEIEREIDFARVLHKSFGSLQEELGDPIFNDARLVSKPLYPPCRSDTERSCPGSATLVTFRLVLVVGSRTVSKKSIFVPYTYLKMQQHVFDYSMDHAVFSRRTFREFAPVLGLSGRSSLEGVSGQRRRRSPRIRSREITQLEQHLTDVEAIELTPTKTAKGMFHKETLFGGPEKWRKLLILHKNPVDEFSFEARHLGGILISHEVTTSDQADGQYSKNSATIANARNQLALKMFDMSTASDTRITTTAECEKESECWLDELFSKCLELS